MSRLHALLVGIDRYLPPADGGDGPFPDLGGCVHDVARMADLLRRRVAGEVEVEVETLTSSVGGEEPADRLPTLDNLRAAVDGLVERSAPGDQVLFFYAGHGARLRTAYPELKGGERGHDEALVPCEAAGCDAPVLRDVELAGVLRKLVDGGAFVTLILDCCHAGGATRQAGGVAVRCAERLNGARRPRAGGFGSRRELTASWRSWQRDADRNLRPAGASGWLPAPSGYVLLAACGADQRAHECRLAPGRRGGALTHFLLAALDQPSPEPPSWSRLHARVLAGVHGVFEDQTPVLEGAAERRPFGGAVRPLPPAVPVVRVEGDGRLLLAAGRAQGVGEGSRLAVFAPDAVDVADPAARLAEVEVVSAGPDHAWAAVRPGAGRRAGAAPAVPPAARAVVVSPGERRLTTAVASRAAGVDAAGRGLLAAVGEAVRGAEGGASGGFLRWVDEAGEAGEPLPDLQVTVGDDRFVVLDPGGAEIPLHPPLPAHTGSLRPLVRRLGHLARYRAVERLHNPDPCSALADRLRLELFRRHAGDRDREPLPPGADGRVRVEDGWKVAVDVRNDARQDLHVALLVLQADRGVSQLWPPPARGGSELLGAGTAHTVGLTARLPAGQRRGRDVLKLLAATGATDYRWLQLPPLGHRLPGTDRGDRAATPLERLLACLTSDRGHPADLSLDAAHGWTTIQVETLMESG